MKKKIIMDTITITRAGGEEKKERRGRKKKIGVTTAKSTYVKKNKTYKYQLESNEVDVVQAKSSKNYRDKKNQERKALIQERDKLKNCLAETEKREAIAKEKIKEYEAQLVFYKQEHLRSQSMLINTPSIASELLALGRNLSESTTVDNNNYSINLLCIMESNQSFNPNENLPDNGQVSLDELDALELVPFGNDTVAGFNYI